MKGRIFISGEKSGGWIIPLLFTELAGIAAGSFAAVFFADSEILQKYICPEVFGGTLFQIIFGTSVTCLMYLVVSFLLGLFLLGQGGGIAFLAGLGAEIGCTAALMYFERGAGAIMWVLLLYLPKTAALSAIGILSAREVIRNSTALLKSTISLEEAPSLKKYCLRFIFLAAGVIIVSVIYGIANYFVC